MVKTLASYDLGHPIFSRLPCPVYIIYRRAHAYVLLVSSGANEKNATNKISNSHEMVNGITERQCDKIHTHRQCDNKIHTHSQFETMMP